MPGDLHAVRQGLARLVEALEGEAEETVSTAEIALAEAMNNIVEHAYRDDVGNIDVEVRSVDNSLAFKLTDKGKPMPDGTVPLGEIPEYPSDPQKMPEGGFGWFLIHDLTSDLSYQRVDGQNELRFCVARG